MERLDEAVALLGGAPRLYFCIRCLSERIAVFYHTARDITETLAQRQHYRRDIERCDGCGRVTVALAFVPPVKCARCSWPIAHNDPFVTEHDELFHHHCWRILESHARIADSQQMARLSRALIERTIGLVERARVHDQR